MRAVSAIVAAMTIRAVLFDLDGTLADTLDGIAASLNQTLERFDMPTHDRDTYRRFVGNGVRKLIERAVPDDRQDQVDAVLEAYLPVLEIRGPAMSRLYPGVIETLGQLHARSLPMGVLSNKPDTATVDVVNHLMGDVPFAIVRGQVDNAPVKPDPTVALQLVGEMGADPADVAYVGDSDVDMQLAHRAGFIGVGAAWGLRGRAELAAHDADHIIDNPRALIDLLK